MSIAKKPKMCSAASSMVRGRPEGNLMAFPPQKHRHLDDLVYIGLASLVPPVA